MEESLNLSVSFSQARLRWTAPDGSKVATGGEPINEADGRLMKAMANGITVITDDDAVPAELIGCPAATVFLVSVQPSELEHEPTTKGPLSYFCRNLSEGEKRLVEEEAERLKQELATRFPNLHVEQLPPGLPPSRETDHAIPLLPGSRLPRPARFGYDVATAERITEIVNGMLE